MPALIGLSQTHARDRDKFQILAVHDKSVKSFAELDPKLARIKPAYWKNQDLPFPVLLDASGTTEKMYGISAHPTGVLIDPKGMLVGEATEADLEAKLPPLSASQKWARHRDMEKNILWSFEPAEYTLNKLTNILTRLIICPVVLDDAEVKAAGLAPDGPLPGVIVGMPITLRSIEELLLASYGLGIVPSPDDTRLVIRRRIPKSEPQSYLQTFRNAELRGRLDGEAAGAPTAPLSIKSLSLIGAVKQISKEFDLPMALDAGAMQTRVLDPQVLVSGDISGKALGQSLKKMLAPAGLEAEVGHEVVLITPKAR